MKEKDIKKQVKLLAKQKKFEQIYYEYGPEYFRKYVSYKYKDQDIEKLMQEGKYLDIYVKYGETYRETYKKDIENELGRKSTLLERTFNKNFITQMMNLLRASIRGMAMGASVSILSSSVFTDIREVMNSQKYAKEINEYENEIKEYSKKFDSNRQSDMEIIMRVMKDMHETIRGYGNPKIDAAGYRGMDVMNEDGIGVCRNMAENVVDKLNEINPKYNARIVTLYMKAADFTEANIEKNTISENTRTNINGNVKSIYVDEILKQTIINQGDTEITYEYKDGNVSKKTIKKPKEEEEVLYDEKGNVLEDKKTITEVYEKSEIEKIFINGRLDTEKENNENYYISKTYDDMGKIRFKTIADKESERTTFYSNNEQASYTTIVKDGYKTTIYYDELGKEVSKTKEETDQTNIFLQLKAIEEDFEELRERENIKTQIANHAIVAMDIKSDGVTLLIDPTNLGLGVYQDGKIIMFNEQQPGSAIYDRSLIGDSSYKGIDGLLEYPVDYVKSFIEPALSMDELEEKYGLEAQNKMLEKIESEDKKNTFKEDLKIDTGITYDFNTNVVSIDNNEKEQKEH